ncbi:hypothetical protein Tco_1303358 [Tanacetum coccineum]
MARNRRLLVSRSIDEIPRTLIDLKFGNLVLAQSMFWLSLQVDLQTWSLMNMVICAVMRHKNNSIANAATKNMNIYQKMSKCFSGMVDLQEEVFVGLPKGFEDQDNPTHVYRLKEGSLWAKAGTKGVKYGMDLSDPVDTPMVDRLKLDEDLMGIQLTKSYQAKPTKKHLEAIKRIFRYLKGTINMGLWYPKDNAMSLTAYADADHAGCQDSRRKHADYDESNTCVLERFNTTARNLVKKILLKLNLSDHRSVLTDSKESIKMVIESAKPKAVTNVATTITTAVTSPKAKGHVIQEHEQASTLITSSKGKGKGIMVEEPLKIKKKDQVLFDEQEAIRLQA